MLERDSCWQLGINFISFRYLKDEGKNDLSETSISDKGHPLLCSRPKWQEKEREMAVYDGYLCLW